MPGQLGTFNNSRKVAYGTITAKLITNIGVGTTATLRYAVCTSDSNKANYLGAKGAVADANQLIIGTFTFSDMTSTYAEKSVATSSTSLSPNTTYYLFLWANDDTGISIRPVSSAYGDHEISIEVSSVIYIDNGSSFDAYQVYIDNGSSLDLYIPYIDNGSSWDMCG